MPHFDHWFDQPVADLPYERVDFMTQDYHVPIKRVINMMQQRHSPIQKPTRLLHRCHCLID
jgi:hypothetical protein